MTKRLEYSGICEPTVRPTRSTRAVTVVGDHLESEPAHLPEPRACGGDDDRIEPLCIDLDEVDGLRCLRVCV